MMRFISTSLILFVISFNGFAQLYKDSSASIEARVADLMSKMTIEDKIGQMTLVDYSAIKNNPSDFISLRIGNLLYGGDSKPGQNLPEDWANANDSLQERYAMKQPLGIPLLIGVDAVHGHANVRNATVFPHNIGLGAANNTELVEEAGRITAQDLVATGVYWNYAPCLAVGRDERWGRTYESYSEDIERVTRMGDALLRGLQGSKPNNKTSVLACLKHFAGDGGTFGGTDRGNTIASETEFRAMYIAPYVSAIASGVGSIMPSFSSWNGMKMHANRYLLDTVLKQELGFKGFLVSDWEAIDLISANNYNNIVSSINAGLDMIMVPIKYKQFIDTLKRAIENGDIPMSRIDDAVRRIITQKIRIGLFERYKAQREFLPMVGDENSRTVARHCVQQSLVVLKSKDNVLPLRKSLSRIVVAGRCADNLGYQCGGWTIRWQGTSGNNATQGTTILQALEKTLGTERVQFSSNGQGAEGADYGIVVVGEQPYAEMFGDNAQLRLAQSDIDAVRNMKRAGTKVICIVISGRPIILSPILPFCDAVIASWLPGTEAQGITDLLMGETPPTGTLPFTWPKSVLQLPINKGDTNYDPLYAYATGIVSFDDEMYKPVKLLSATTNVEGTSVELAFNHALQTMVSMSTFEIVSNNEPQVVTSVHFKFGEPSVLVLELKKPIIAQQIVNVSYRGRALASASGGAVYPFENFEVYNMCNEITRNEKLPGLIEAERYYDQHNVSVLDCFDRSGGQSVEMEPGEWIQFQIDVPFIDDVDILLRALVISPTVLDLEFNGTFYGRFTLNSTNEWATTVAKGHIYIKGRQTLTVRCISGGLQLNWLAFDMFHVFRKSELGKK